MGAGLFQSPDLTRSVEREEMRPQEKALRLMSGWNPENYAREQIRSLVRKVFFSNAARPVRQIVISAVDPETDVRTICRRVGETLAQETPGHVAVVGEDWQVLHDVDHEYESEERAVLPGMPLQRIATRVRGNLWLVPGAAGDGVPDTTASLHSYLGEVRREFEYSIVEGRPAGESNETAVMAQFADGIILVLSAQRTRRATAWKIKELLEGARANLLGTVLSDRSFPVPEAIYRRL
jgi:hypothetical protein